MMTEVKIREFAEGKSSLQDLCDIMDLNYTEFGKEILEVCPGHASRLITRSDAFPLTPRRKEIVINNLRRFV